MKIQYCSDLHIEFPENRAYLKKHPIQPVADILLLAGDILPLVLLEDHAYFLDELSEKFKVVLWLPGNHEYYYYNLAQLPNPLNLRIRQNILLVNNVAVDLHGIQFIFSTLWSNITPANRMVVQQGLSDFQVIGNGKELISPDKYNQLHQESLLSLKGEFEKPAMNPRIVITHHVPTFQNYPEKYKGNAMNDAFVTELSDLIIDSKIDYWIFGHHHYNTKPFKIANTEMLTNQLGYVVSGEHHAFEPGKCLDVIL